ncbi:hypothetical protein C0Q70_15263 [Pomacea canaliculata]|uniref:Uncharacterized protein n=1 Tax=Pomacea canaliculata TaxID=400727 RepID=A0A2T7NUC2_POMCA|nr:hypothetical protein C0Q70_15263 [Pomacea canaliculata]
MHLSQVTRPTLGTGTPRLAFRVVATRCVCMALDDVDTPPEEFSSIIAFSFFSSSSFCCVVCVGFAVVVFCFVDDYDAAVYCVSVDSAAVFRSPVDRRRCCNKI